MKKPVQLAPSLLACDLGALKKEVTEIVSAGADVLHLDVMDGHFVPNLSMGIPTISSIRKMTQATLDAHLMISNPDDHLENFQKAGCDWLSVHIEVCPHILRTLSAIRDLGMRPGVVLNPGTPLSMIEPALSEAEYVLVMSVNPGFGGQSFIEGTLQRIEALRKMIAARPIDIEVDGGIKLENAKKVYEAGADILVMGTGIFHAKDYKERLNAIRGECNGVGGT